MEDNRYYFGNYYGKVTDNEDPDNLGRVKVKLDFMGESVETSWIPVMAVFASDKCGSFFIPEVGDHVIVGFLSDNAEHGVVLGGLWSDNHKVPETGENTASDLNKDGDNNLRFIKTRSGHMLIFDDKDGQEKIQLISAGGKTRYEFSAKDEKINIETDKDLKLKAEKKLSIEADEAEITLNKGFKLDASDVVIKSQTKDIEIKANQNIKVKGTGIKLN